MIELEQYHRNWVQDKMVLLQIRTKNELINYDYLLKDFNEFNKN